MMPTDTIRLVSVMILWAICFPLIVIGLELSPHLTFAALRAGIGGAILIVVGLLLGRSLPRDWRVWIWLFVVGLGATTLGFVGMFHAAEFVSPGIATVIANTQPLMAAIAAQFLLNERLDTWRLFGLILGFGGVLLIAAPTLVSGGGGAFGAGVGYLLLAAAGITGANVVMKRLVGRVDPIMAMGVQIFLGGISLGLIALATEDPTAVEWSLRFLLVLAALAVPGTALAFWLWFSVLERVQLAKANSFSFLVSLFGLAIGVGMFDERIGGIQAVGIGVTVIGILVVCIGRDRQDARRRQSCSAGDI